MATNEDGSILGGLDEALKVGDLADRAAYSEAQFYRLTKKELGEPPMTARRRLLLERAAFRLSRTNQAVTEIAFDAGFESLEGFSRSFRRSFRVSPSTFRKLKADEYRIDLSERIHYAPPGEGARPRQGEPMLVQELMTEHHAWQVAQYLSVCSALTAEQLDERMDTAEPFQWHSREVTLRQMLGRAVAFAAPWMDAINGIRGDYHPTDLSLMPTALIANRDGMLDIIRAVEADKSYDLTFVDSTCEPPEVFSYGWVIAHVLTHSMHRRIEISRHFRARGIEFEERLDPSGFEAL